MFYYKISKGRYRYAIKGLKTDFRNDLLIVIA